MTTQFDSIYFNQSRASGRMRMMESGLGWKASEKGGSATKNQEPQLIPSEELLAAHWSRGARGYEVRIQTKNKGVAQLDGFDQEDFNAVKNAFKHNFDMNLENVEHSVRGWNWGRVDFERSEMVFNVQNKPAFEINYGDISNTNLVGKAEVALEFNLQTASEREKAGDEIVEMRFYVPGTVQKTEDGEIKPKIEKKIKEEDDAIKQEEDGSIKQEEDGSIKQEDDDSIKQEDDSSIKQEDGEEDGQEQSAAQYFYESVKDRADIGQIAGDAIVSFTDVLFLTPRGRYDIDMYPTSFRLRGKTYDYKIQYKTVERIFLLPKPDELHNIIIIQLDPPLRQGQTRYPFLVIQFLKEEEIEVELNVENDVFEKKYADKLKKKYDEAAHQVVGQLFKGLTGKRVIFPASYTTTHGQAGVSCSLKASEGYFYPLDKCFLFVPKPTVYIPYSEVSSVKFSRVGGSVSSSRTFDMTIVLRSGAGEHQFSNIAREEQSSLESYIKSKNIKIKNEDSDDQTLLAAALGDESEDSDVDMIDRGSADEDEESEDEDFEDDDISDVAEEFDEDHESNSDEGGDGDDDSENSEQEAPSKKKVKTASA